MYLWRSSQFPDEPQKIADNPLTNFTERDMIQWATSCGFKDVHMELHIDVKPSLIDWETFVEISPHPLAPNLQTIMHEKFSDEEQLFFTEFMKPIIESDSATSNYRIAYLSATK
jgi:hypothetical protein